MIRSFKISDDPFSTSHEIGNKNCTKCETIRGWRDDELTKYPIPCDICGEGLMHGQEDFADDSMGGLSRTHVYKCDNCGEF